MLDFQVTTYLKSLKGKPPPYLCNLCTNGEKSYKTVRKMQ